MTQPRNHAGSTNLHPTTSKELDAERAVEVGRVRSALSDPSSRRILMGRYRSPASGGPVFTGTAPWVAGEVEP